jgi:hypothetical protein
MVESHDHRRVVGHQVLVVCHRYFHYQITVASNTTVVAAEQNQKRQPWLPLND